MEANGLLARIHSETGLVIFNASDQYVLSGMFNRYRPSGQGIERILDGDNIRQEIRYRVKRVYEISAPSWRPGDLYFVVRYFEPICQTQAVRIVIDHLSGIKRLADFVGDRETSEAITMLKVVGGFAPGLVHDDEVPTLIYECLTDFISRFQFSQNEIFVLKEALFSMANDYFLMAYMLWPAIQAIAPVQGVIEPYIDIWRCGIRIDYSGDGQVCIHTPG